MTDIYSTKRGSDISDIDLESLFCPVWVLGNIDGTIADSNGVSSLTDVATGRVGVNFSNPFIGSTSYVGFVCGQATSAASFRQASQDTTNLTASRSDFTYRTTILADPTKWNIACMGTIL